MKKTLHKDQRGITHIALLLTAIAVVVIGFAAYRVKTNDTLSGSSDSSQRAAVNAPAKIQSKSDLTTASQALQTTPINADLNPKQLDGSINSLL